MTVKLQYGANQSYNATEKRIGQLMNKDKNTALKMDSFEKILNWFSDGERNKARENIYKLIHADSTGSAISPFLKLREMVSDEVKGKFSLELLASGEMNFCIENKKINESILNLKDDLSGLNARDKIICFSHIALINQKIINDKNSQDNIVDIKVDEGYQAITLFVNNESYGTANIEESINQCKDFREISKLTSHLYKLDKDKTIKNSKLHDNTKYETEKGYFEYTKLHSKASQLIIKAYSNWQSVKKNQTANDLGVKTFANKGVKYYFPQDDLKVPYFKTPKNSIPEEGASQGAFKRVAFIDPGDGYVQLTSAKRPNKTGLYQQPEEIGTHKDRAASNKMAEVFKGYPSVLAGYFVDKNTNIVRNGGKEVKDMVNKGAKLSINVFKNACLDLDKMHKNGIFHRDIKPANMVIKDSAIENPEAKFIDLDMAVTKNIGDKNKACGTPGYTNKALLNRKYKNADEIDMLLKSSDQYAMIKTLMYSSNIDDIKKNMKSQWSIDQIGYKFDDEFSAEAEWINNNVKNVYQDQIKKFLHDPASNPLAVDLAEAFEF